MEKNRNHYENLKVMRDAPPEVIRAAYRTLALKYHPDKNNGNSESTRIMALLNAAFEVLSDPEKRREHDQWIEAQEASKFSSYKPKSEPSPDPADYQAEPFPGFKETVPPKQSQQWQQSPYFGVDMSGQGSGGNVIAALASFFIPGLGQLLQGRILKGAFMFISAAVLWWILMGWIIHLWSIIDAALFKPNH